MGDLNVLKVYRYMGWYETVSKDRGLLRYIKNRLKDADGHRDVVRRTMVWWTNR